MSSQTTPRDAEVLAAIKHLDSAPSWTSFDSATRAIRNHSETQNRSERARVLETLEAHAGKLLLPPTGQIHLDRALLSLPPLLEQCRVQSKNQKFWHDLRKQISTIAEKSASTGNAASLAIILLVCDGIIEGCAEGLVRLARRLDAGGLPVVAALQSSNIDRYLQPAGWFERDLTVLLRFISAQRATLLRSTPGKFTNLAFIVSMVFARRSHPSSLLDAIFTQMMVPVFELGAQDPNYALITGALETICDSDYLRQQESEARFAEVHKIIAQLLFAAGRRVAGSLLSDSANYIKNRHVPPKVAFFLNVDYAVAHVSNLLVFLRGLCKLSPRPIDVIIYFEKLKDPKKILVSELDALGIPYRKLAPSSHLSLAMKQCAQEDGVAAIVFVSVPLYVAFSTGLRVAPAVIWWAMKYHRMDVPELGYMTTGGFFEKFRTIAGRTWRSCPAPPPILTDSRPAPQKNFREKYNIPSGAVVLGCIGREEKLLSDSYLDALARIMAACPSAVFVWTGKSRSQEVQDALEARDLGVRSTSLGWLEDTRCVTQYIDVYVDSFPFASGHTAFEAMIAGVPTVVLKTPEAIETSTATAVVPIVEGLTGTPEQQARAQQIFSDQEFGSLLTYVGSIEEFVNTTIRLIQDIPFRTRAGNAAKDFLETLAPKETDFAAATCTHILEMIAERDLALIGEKG